MKKAKMGQHFLIDKRIIRKITNLINGKIILEIGGGKGNLTKEVVKNANFHKLYVVEKDKYLAAFLKALFEKNKKVVIINDDFLNVKPFKVDVIFGNIPYYISSEILFKLYEWDFKYAILMFQKEFVEKMTAKIGSHDFGRLSFNAQNKYNIKPLFYIDEKAFSPKPKVKSCLIRIEKKEPIIKNNEELINKIFSQKNKKIKNIIKLKDHLLKDIGEKRPWQLTFEEIKKLIEYEKN